MSQAFQFLLKGRRPFLLLALATLAVWGQTVRFGFVWDDSYFIRDLQSVRSLRHVPEIFYRLDAQSTVPDGFVLFRPIRTLHYAVLHLLDGAAVPQPWVYHLANVMWHGAAAMMLFAVLTLLLPQLQGALNEVTARGWALFVALAFAVHPVVSEVVCWAKSLDDILAAFFVLAALWQLLQPQFQRAQLWRSLLFFALALYSKESAVPFALVPLMVFRGIRPMPWKQCLARTGGFLAVAVVYTIHRHLVIGRTSQTAPISGTYFQTLVDMFPVVFKYVRLLFGIPPFFIDYTYLRGGYALTSPAVVAGAVVLLALTVAAVLAWRRRETALFGFGLLWMGLFLLPVSNLLPMMQYMAERFLYLPLMGWLMVLAACGIAFATSPRGRLVGALKPVGVVLLVVWAGVAWNRSWIWQDDLTLFVRSAQEGPPTLRVRENAVAAILELPNVQAVFSYDRKSNLLSYRNGADAAARASALRTFENAQHMFPDEPVLLSCLGISLATTGQPDQGLGYLERASTLDPNNVAYALNWARAGLDAKQLATAKTALDKAAALAPMEPAVLQVQFNYCWARGDYPAAREVILRLNQLAPSAENARRLAAVEDKMRAGDAAARSQG